MWEVEFGYTPGSPGCHTQRNGDPGWPADPAEYEFLAIRLASPDTTDSKCPDLTPFLLEEDKHSICAKVEEYDGDLEP
jgi:hypothetical protein